MGENNKTNKAYRAYGLGIEHKLAGMARELGMINTVFSGGKLRKTARGCVIIQLWLTLLYIEEYGS